MKTLSKNALIGYPAGIITGISYGLNPLFGMAIAMEAVTFIIISTKTITENCGYNL